MLKSLRERIEGVEQAFVVWVERRGVDALRVTFGLVFLWFGVLKFCPGLCDVELLAGKTVRLLTLGLFPMKACLMMLAVLETTIGISLLTGRFLRVTCWLLMFHLCGTFLPLVLFPAETWKHVGLAPTLTGQYILKNLILLGGAVLIAGKALRQERRGTIHVMGRRRVVCAKDGSGHALSL